MRIVVPNVAANVHARAFDEVARTLVGGLSRLGIPCEVTTVLGPDGNQVVLAPHLHTIDTLAQLPRGSILYTWEPIGATGSRLMTAAHSDLLRQFVIWDYSEKNLAEWRRLGAARVVHVPLGHDPALLGLVPALPEPDIDVLFYGSTNERRLKILAGLQERGLVVGTLFGGYGLERDAAIARARLVLNLHFYESGILEIARLSYLWANRKPVFCEINPATEVPFQLRDVALSAPYEGIIEGVVHALADPSELSAQADMIAGHFARHGDAATVLQEALARTHDFSAVPTA